jgi:hypothetical protein
MPITDAEWGGIADLAERVAVQTAGTKLSYFVTGTVVRSDQDTMCVWLKEFGEQPIPIVGFKVEVTYYDETPAGTKAPSVGSDSPYKLTKKKAKVKTLVPDPGQLVLVVREMGETRIPRCLGVILGTDWIIPEDE